MARALTDEEKASAQAQVNRARAAMAAVDHYDQAMVDRLCRAVAWATANEQTFGRLTRMSVEESGMGECGRRAGPTLENPRHPARRTAHQECRGHRGAAEAGIVKYAKPAGVIAGLLPVTNPYVTMVEHAINAIECQVASSSRRIR